MLLTAKAQHWEPAELLRVLVGTQSTPDIRDLWVNLKFRYAAVVRINFDPTVEHSRIDPPVRRAMTDVRGVVDSKTTEPG